MKTNELVKQYPWLAKVNTAEDYLPPEYYQHLLKPYTFGGVSDLSLLEKFLYNKKPSKVLELGCGSGRASGIAVSAISTADYTFSDLSERMLKAAKQHLPKNSSFFVSDAIEYMENARDVYELVYTPLEFFAFNTPTYSSFRHKKSRGLHFFCY